MPAKKQVRKPSKKQMEQAGNGLFSSIMKMAKPLLKSVAPKLIDAGCSHIKKKVAGAGRKRKVVRRRK